MDFKFLDDESLLQGFYLLPPDSSELGKFKGTSTIQSMNCYKAKSLKMPNKYVITMKHNDCIYYCLADGNLEGLICMILFDLDNKLINWI